ncbi:MAG: cobalamin biosynthesis protein CobD [Chloroflexi bacterium RBG_13_48_10]|nr:MAG: cobalamin biosynthesis protein CobD [Chloroflexi bacterium RBG_13_48_10]
MNLASLPNYFLIVVAGSALWAIVFDALIGDPHKKWHPVNLIGLAINDFKRKLLSGYARKDKFFGILLIFLVTLLIGGAFFAFQVATWGFLGIWDSSLQEGFLKQLAYVTIYTILMGIGLKWTFAIRNLGDETEPIMKALQTGNLVDARSRLRMIVRRDTMILDESHVISATVEVIAESSTDSITSVFWYYFKGCFLGLFVFKIAERFTPTWVGNYLWLFMGIPFAYLFRTINTADSIVGYMDPENVNIGWFSAKMDTLSHVISTPLTVACMLLVGKVLKLNARNGWKIFRTDRKKASSSNAGWTIGVMAGLLNVRLEKIGHYKLGNPERTLIPADVRMSFKVVRIASFLCIAILACIFLPLMTIFI